PTHLFAEDGDVAWRARRTIWGVPCSSPDDDHSVSIPLRCPGQYADEETGWHYNVHRHYDPESARYATPDPLGLVPAPNPYGYAHNPVTWCDPSGLAPHPPSTPGFRKQTEFPAS